MILKYLATALLSTALMTGSVLAETTTAPEKTSNAAITHKEGEWRSSKLVGIDVYNAANDKVGEIEELIVDKSGKIEKAILGVGGFLGMGEHYVAVSFDKLRWVNEPVKTSNATAPENKSTVGTTATGEPKRTDRPARAANETWYPDHAVYNVTKDELKAMPQFKYN